MQMDSDDQNFIRKELEAIVTTIREETNNTNILLLAILNQLRKERGELPLSLPDVVRGKEKTTS